MICYYLNNAILLQTTERNQQKWKTIYLRSKRLNCHLSYNDIEVLSILRIIFIILIFRSSTLHNWWKLKWSNFFSCPIATPTCSLSTASKDTFHISSAHCRRQQFWSLISSKSTVWLIVCNKKRVRSERVWRKKEGGWWWGWLQILGILNSNGPYPDELQQRLKWDHPILKVIMK